MTALSFIFGLFRVREASKKESLTLKEKEALEILENTECIFLRQAYTYFQRAYDASSENERRCKLALAESAVKKSKALYRYVGAEIPEKYLSAVQTILLEFEKRKQVRQDLATAYRLEIQDGSDPLL